MKQFLIISSLVFIYSCSKPVSQVDAQRISNLVNDISPKVAIGGPFVDHKEWIIDYSATDSRIIKHDQRFNDKYLTVDSISDTQVLTPIKHELRSYIQCLRGMYRIDIVFPVVAATLDRSVRAQQQDSLLTQAFRLLDQFDSLKNAISLHSNEFNRLSSALGLVDSLRYKRFTTISREMIINDYVYCLRSETKERLLKKDDVAYPL